MPTLHDVLKGIQMDRQQPGANQSNLLTREEAADRLGLRPQTLAAWATRDQGPPYIKLGRSVRYPDTELDAWLASRLVRPGG